MARRSRCIGIVVCVLAAQHVAAQDGLEKILATDALWNGMKKDVHSHLERMLQIETEPQEPASLESCSPAALGTDKKCVAKSSTDSKVAAKPSSKSAPATTNPSPDCKGPNCLVAPMPSPTGGRSAVSEVQAPAPVKVVTYGPMTQEAFERMVQRKRASLRADMQKAGTLTAELDAFLQTSGGQVKDAFGIPLPAAPKVPQTRADFEMRFAPQAPAADPVTTASSSSSTTSATTTTATKTSAPSDDFEMRFAPQTPAPDPNLVRPNLHHPDLLHKELEALMASSPLAAPSKTSSHTHARTSSSSSSSVRASSSLPKPAREDAPSGPARPPMTEQEAARVTSQQAANAAARDAAREHKRQIAWKEPITKSAAAAAKKAKLASATTTTTNNNNNNASTASANRNVTATPQPQQYSSARSSGNPTITSANVRRVKRSATSSATKSSSWGLLGYLLAFSLVAASAVALFVAAAVAEDILRDRQAGSGDVLALTRGLWRRCRRAFSAARKQLTGHSSDLPLSTNEGAGPLARAVAAASAFVHVFWTHLAADSSFRGAQLHIGGAVAAAIDASRRASAGGVPADRTSSGGSVQYGTTSSYIIEADTGAAATATAELNLRRRH